MSNRHAVSAETEQLQQRLWVKEQEATALKVQNRHLISKLEEANKAAQPNQINTHAVSTEIQNQIRPLIAEVEKTMKESFDILKNTMRGIYQQSQRAQQAVEEMSNHSKDLELRTGDQRKSDQTYYQEKILSQVTAFGDRIERQLENRLRNLSVVELMNTKQNEVLLDIENLKSTLAEIKNELRNLRPNGSVNLGVNKITELYSDSHRKKIEMLEEIEKHKNFLKEAQQHIHDHIEEEISSDKPDTLSDRI